MTDHTWVAGLVYNPLPGRTSPRRRFIKSPFPPQTPTGGGTPTSLASPLPSPPITPNSTTPPPPRRVTPPITRPKSRTTILRARGHDKQGSIDGVVSASVAIPTRLGGHERTGSSGSGIAPQAQTGAGSSPPATGSSPAGEGLASPRSGHQQPTSPSTGSPLLGTNTPHGNAGNPKRIMLRELLPRVLATPALENAPEDLGRFARLQTLALHIFQDSCAFDTDDLSRFLAAPLSPPALRAFSDTVLEAWGRSAPAAIRIPPNTPIRIVDPHSDLSALDASPLELCSAATCACLLWTNMFPERYLAISRSSHSRGGGALDLSAEVRPAPFSIGLEDIESATVGSAFTSGAAASGAAYSVGITRSGMSVTLFKARVPIGLGDNVGARIRQSLQPWQKASHSALMPLLGVTMGGSASNTNMIVCPPGGTGWPVALPGTPSSDSDISLVYAGPPRTRLGLAMPTATGEAYRMLRALAKALRYLHQLRPALVHGGVRPDTILLTPSGDPALSESGLAKIIEDLAVGGGATDGAGVPGSPGNASSSTTRPMPPGALRYTAPELFGENRALARRTTRSDVYAFGCVVYEVFTGEVPFFDVPENRVPRALYDGQTLKRPSPLNAALFPHALPINDELWTLITRCCAFDLSRRPTMAQVVGMLNVARSADSAGPGAMVHVAQPAGASNPSGAGSGGGQAELMEWLLGVVPSQSPNNASAAPPAQSYPMGGVGAALEPAAIMALVESASKVAQASPPVLVN